MLKIPDKGCDESVLFERLESFRGGDNDFRSGKMFGHAFFIDDKVTEIAERAYTMYLWENALDPTLFPSLAEMENEVVSMAASHLRGDDEVVGNFTSGGTESILLAVLAARNKARAEKPGMGKPELIVPVTAHAAFHKAAHYFDMTLVPVPVDRETFKADVDAITKAVTPNTALIVCSAVSYAQGVVDPIKEVGEVALKNGIPFHVDGCIGAFLLPYYRQLGDDVVDFDFTVPGVTSISMDFHKYGFAAKGASVVLYKNDDFRLHQIFSCSKWTGYTLLNPTMQSSRSGGALAATWAVLNYVGNEKYLEVVGQLRKTTEDIIAGIESIDDLYVMGKPEICILGIASDTVDVFQIVDEMRIRGWHIQPQFGLGEYRENFHMTVLPPNVARINEWLADLRECVETAKKREPNELILKIAESLSGNDNMEIDKESLKGLLGSLGVSGDKAPARMADINRILNSLPPEVADRFLTMYYNEIGRYRDDS